MSSLRRPLAKELDVKVGINVSLHTSSGITTTIQRDYFQNIKKIGKKSGKVVFLEKKIK